MSSNHQAGTHVVVTGSSGFVGRHVVGELLSDNRLAAARFTLVDVVPTPAGDDPRVRTMVGNLRSAQLLAEAVGDRADIVVHLAGILGGMAEQDYALARAVNLDATLSLFELLRDADAPPRVVFASSIAVFGPPLPDPTTDDSTPHPVMTYGAQKLQMEIALEQFTARGWLDGIGLRLPGIVARADADARLKSAFLNRLFFAHASGQDLELPVSRDGTTWLLSARQAARSFAHAALLPGGRLGRQRAFVLPSQRVRVGDLVDELATRYPASATTVTYAPDEAVEAQFARYPKLRTSIGDALGFRHDGSLRALVDNAVLTS